jgi:hypothetical protein
MAATNSPNSLANLRPPAPGEARNPHGRNGRGAQMVIAKFLDEASADANSTRIQKVLFAAYTSSLIPGPKGAIDRKTLLEYYAGKPRQALDLSSEDGTMRPKILEVHWVKPEDQPTPAPQACDGTRRNKT